MPHFRLCLLVDSLGELDGRTPCARLASLGAPVVSLFCNFQQQYHLKEGILL